MQKAASKTGLDVVDIEQVLSFYSMQRRISTFEAELKASESSQNPLVEIKGAELQDYDCFHSGR